MKEKQEPDFGQLAGRVFKDGPYEYRIYIKSGSLGDDTIVAVSLFIENIPPYVGVDLYMYAMGHIVEVAGTAIDNSEWMINKVVMEEYENLGDMSSAIMGTDKVKDFGLQPLSSLMNKIKINLNKKMDLEELNRKVQVRLAKMIKLIKYMQKNVTSVKDIPIQISYQANGAPKRYQETLVPGITVKVKVTYDKTYDETKPQLETRDLRSQIEDMLKEYSPIEWHPYDTITVAIDPIRTDVKYS
jgi:hypothetical protein